MDSNQQSVQPFLFRTGLSDSPHPSSASGFAKSGSNREHNAIDSSLGETTFVVVDLETTGMRAGEAQIIEIGAVRVTEGQIDGTFSTFVDPGVELPYAITRLTGIRETDLDGAPQLGSVLPQFLDFARGAVWVAHNAPFDMGFLRAGCAELGIDWPAPTIVDTLTLARKTLRRSDVGSFRLSDLARYVGASTSPTHRALDDAKATVDVMHYLFERLAGFNVETVDSLIAFTPNVAPEIRAKRSLIDNAPHAPGVYIFRSANNDPLYIGTAVDLRRRLLQYFNGTDSRKRMAEMVRLAESVDTVECAHGMAAEVREARLLSSQRPPYNRQRKEPSRGWYLVPHDKKDAAVSARTPRGHLSLGPFRTRDITLALADELGIRQGNYQETMTALLSGDNSAIENMLAEIQRLADSHRFQRASLYRDRTAALIYSLDKQQRLSALANLPLLNLAYPDDRGGWNLAIIKYGRLAAATNAPRGSNATYIAALLDESAETVIPTDNLYRGASVDELSIIWSWLIRPEMRIGPTEGILASPIQGAGRYRAWADEATKAKRESRSTRNRESRSRTTTVRQRR